MALDKKLQMLQQHFDSLAQRTDSDGIEFWFARDLQPHLGYVRWETSKPPSSDPLKPAVYLASKNSTIFVASRKWFCWAAARNGRLKTLF